MGKRKSLNLVTAVVIAGVLAGCGSSKGMMNETAAYEVAAEAPAAAMEEYLYDAGYDMAAGAAVENAYDTAAMPEEMPEEAVAQEFDAEAGAGEAKNQAQELPENPQAGRKLITTMNLSAETEHFDELMGNLERQIAELGGYIENSDQWNGSVDYYGNRINDRSASLTVRIPIEKLDGFLSLMEENSNITNKSKNVEDVTLAYVDLESHKKALLTAEERLLELLEKAETVEDLIAIEEKLTDVRYQLESMESQLRTYDNKINYSTVYLNIQEVTRLTPVEAPTTWSRIKNGFSENLYNLGEGIKDFFIGVVINIPYIVMWIIILGIGAFIGFLVVKHDKKRKEKRRKERQQTEGNGAAAQKEAEGPLPYGVKKSSMLSAGRWKKGGRASVPETEQGKPETAETEQGKPETAEAKQEYEESEKEKTEPAKK